MSQAEDLLNKTSGNSVSTYTATPSTEGHIIINADRIVHVPDELRTIAVQYDHNIETVTFDCLRYWDGHDLSTMRVFINYMRPDNKIGQYPCDDVTVDTTDSDTMHFTWTISGHVTEVKGPISFLVCVKTSDEDGTLTNRWNSRLNQEMVILEGMNASSEIAEMAPDVIASILSRLDLLESIEGDGSQGETTQTDSIYLKANVVIPAGRVKGDVTGDGVISEEDYTLISNLATGTVDPLTDHVDIWSADVNGDGSVDSKDAVLVMNVCNGVNVEQYSQYAADYYEHWQWDDLNYIYYYDIPISGMTEDYSATIFTKSHIDVDAFDCVCITNGIRIRSRAIPIEDVWCDIVYSKTTTPEELTITLPAGRAKGDVTGDGLLGEDDYTMITDVSMGNVDPLTDPVDIWAADVNGDGVINAKDAALVMYKIDGSNIVQYARYAADYYENWQWDNINLCYYYDVSVSGVTEEYAVKLYPRLVGSSMSFTANSRQNVIRISSDCIPTTEVECTIVYGKTLPSVSIHSPAETSENYEVDTTLSVAGKAADAKAVGDILGDISAILDAINGEVV